MTFYNFKIFSIIFLFWGIYLFLFFKKFIHSINNKQRKKLDLHFDNASQEKKTLQTKYVEANEKNKRKTENERKKAKVNKEKKQNDNLQGCISKLTKCNIVS